MPDSRTETRAGRADRLLLDTDAAIHALAAQDYTTLYAQRAEAIAAGRGEDADQFDRALDFKKRLQYAALTTVNDPDKRQERGAIVLEEGPQTDHALDATIAFGAHTSPAVTATASPTSGPTAGWSMTPRWAGAGWRTCRARTR